MLFSRDENSLNPIQVLRGETAGKNNCDDVAGRTDFELPPPQAMIGGCNTIAQHDDELE